MSIKPTDFQIMYPKLTEVSKIHSDTQNRNQAVNQQQAETTKQHAEDKITKVEEKEDIKDAKIYNKEGKREKREKNKGKNKKKDNEDEEHSTIDIKI